MKKMLLAFLVLFQFTSVSAQVLVRDVGVIGLMSHDLFSWDRVQEINTENGRLDLSTIFDYDGGSRWKKGGNTKNAENAPVYSITMELVEFYQKLLKTTDEKEARKKTVVYFIEMVKESYQRLSGLSFPTTALNAPVTNIEQAVLRGMHDILPGKIKLFNKGPWKELKVTSFVTAKLRLSQKELDQEVKPFDGDYDLEYQAIKIPFTSKTINLKEIDRKFIEKFSPYFQQDILAQLKLVGENKLAIKNTFFIHHFEEMMMKALCSEENEWLPKIECY